MTGRPSARLLRIGAPWPGGQLTMSGTCQPPTGRQHGRPEARRSLTPEVRWLTCNGHNPVVPTVSMEYP